MNLGASRSSADFSVPHDPRVKSKSLLSTENNVSTFNTLPSLILNGQNTIQTSFAPNTSSSYPKSLETKAQNDDGQFRNSDIMHGKMSRTKPLIKYHDPMLHEIHINDAFRRDSRTLESVKTTPYLNHKKYRKAKYRQQNKGFAINKNQINQDQDKYHSLVSKKMEKNNIIGCPYNSFGPVNETATIKFNKIPKLKTFEDNINSTAVLKTDEKSFKFPPEINLETIVNIPNKVIKDQRSSKSEQNSVLIDYIYQNKSKKQKKCSKEKEFEKIIKDADCSNNDIWVPSRRTRSSVKQKEILENVNVNNSKPKFEIDIITKNDKKIEYSECIKNYDCVSIPVAEDVCGRNEIRHNIISSPSKEQSGVVNPTIARCISQQKNMVSTNEINFTADDHRKVVNKYWLDLLKNQKCKDAINIFQDKDKIKKQKEKQKRKKTKKKVSAESSKNSNEERKNKFLNCISDDNNFNQAENRVEIKKKKSHLNKLNKGSTSFGNIYGHLSTGQHKLKSNESYGNFEILKDRCIFEKKQLKIVIAKLDGNIEGSENCNADTSTNNNIQTNNKPLNIKRAQEIKYKKPFVGPLSVKLARQKMEMELSDSKYERDIKNQLKFETRKVRKKSKAVNRLDKKEKLNSETYIVNKPKLRKARRSELDKHRANITGTFHCEPVLNASTKRLRRTDKKIDYVKTNTSTNNYSQTNNEPLNVQIPQEIKYKKPFVGPLSVKLARQKMEMELSDSQYKRDIKNQLDIETRKVRKKSKSVDRFDKKEELISETSTSLMIEQPIVLIRPFENNKLLDKITDSNKPFKQNSKTSTYIVNKPKLRKTKSELDKLCANITGMFYYENIINAPTKRQCRTNKKIDNVKTKEVSLKEKVTSNIEVSGLNEDKSKFIFKVGKPKNIKKKVQKSTIVLNKKKQFVKKSVANQTNNFGGKPVIQQCQVIYESKDNDDHNQQISVTDLNAQANDQKQPDSLFSIENKCYEQTIDEIEQNSIIDESTPESSIIHVNLPVSVNDKILPELNMLQFLPEQANQSPTKETRISTEQPEIQYSEYTFKEKSKTFVLAGLSCELINSMLLFKCSVSSCLEKFSTSVLIDFSKHIITNHQFVIWDGNCEACHHKSSIISDQYYVKDALEHLISHHLVLKNTEQHPNAKANLEGLSSFCQDSVSGDKLSVHKPRSSSISDICDISVSKSLSDDTNSIIKNVIQQCQVIYESKDNDDHNQQISVTDLNAQANDQKQPDSLFSIENKCYEQTIDEIEQNSIIDESTPESSIIHVNLPVSVNDKILPELNMLQFLPEQANQSPTKETRISTEQPEIQYSEYTFKEKSKTFVLAGLSCELINSMLLFKCSVSSCLEKFSTSVLIDFSKHIITNHQFVIWDGNCEACHHKSSIISDQYYVKDALEHLISHHLVLKNTEQHPNAKANLEGLSSFCQASVSGDKLSVHKQRSSSISNICDMSVSISLGDDTNSINKNVNLNINHGSNDKKLTLSSLQISDVKSLKKRKVNTSKINSNASHNEDLNMWMKSKTISEVVVSNSETFLEEGQQIVNNGVPIDDTIFLIDTAYTKNYFRKLRDFPMSVMKTQLAFNKMSVLPRLMGLFKCMERYCTKIFCSKKLFKLHMAIHFSNAEKKKNQIYNVQQFKMCAYCFKTFDDEESLADHIAEKYSFCEYFCPYCFYRAYTASHVFVHQSVVHTNISKPCIIQLQNDDAAFEYPREQLLVVDFKEFVLPYKCNIGCCGFSCYLHHEFLEHLNQKHKKCDKFCCYICANKDNGGGYFALCPSLLITHFKLHNLNKYQCIFCLFGSEIIDVMIKHLAFEHFEYDLLCLERSTVSDDCESKNIKNLKILRLKKVIDDGVVEMVNYLSAKPFSEPEAVSQQSKKRLIECPDDILSIAMKSARFDEGSQPPDAIVSTVPDSVEIADISTSAELTVHNNEFIIIDDDENQNDTHVPLKITRVWSEFLNKEKNSEESSDDDIIVINDEDDVDLSEKENLNDCLKKQKESTNESNEGKRLVFPIELDKLFVCKKCEIVFSNGAMYCAHLKSRCPFWDKVAGQKCMYCDKVYKMAKSLIEHIKLHGPDRFNCSLCNLKVPTQRAITRHMKKHNIININFVPDCSNLTDFDKDYFTVFENKTVNTEKEEELPCNQCPFKGSVLEIMSHMIIYHTAEQNMDDGEQQPNDSNNSTNSLIRQQVEQQNTRLKIKRFTVDQVVGHQHNNMLSTELNKNSKTILVNNKRKSYSPTRKNNIAHKKKVLVSQFIPDPVSNDDIIDLVDDSDTNN
ncbi:uncharacterized protein LOC111026733 [Myzus persicae]|uniref:uncharacterized protein LOC111026733 n=1 Tax=Myzus persicae TaxID=13164 RepID=UPI000B935A15|nr:uncharacterized protein LOC111026733 [Myzus persicae]